MDAKNIFIPVINLHIYFYNYNNKLFNVCHHRTLQATILQKQPNTKFIVSTITCKTISTSTPLPECNSQIVHPKKGIRLTEDWRPQQDLSIGKRKHALAHRHCTVEWLETHITGLGEVGAHSMDAGGCNPEYPQVTSGSHKSSMSSVEVTKRHAGPRNGREHTHTNTHTASHLGCRYFIESWYVIAVKHSKMYLVGRIVCKYG